VNVHDSAPHLRRRAAAGLLVAIAGIAAAGGIGWPAGTAAAPPGIRRAAIPPSASRVDIRQFKFSAATLAVPAGTTVVWTNRDEELHTVTSAERVFASPGLDAGETFAFTFTTPGTFRYYCALHPHMTGTVVVR
jgi:plastocyanin